MKQGDKELLLKDLCARLPYGVFCNIGLNYPLQLQILFVNKLDRVLLDFYKDGKDYQAHLDEVKPYLFPFSSMTEEQKNEYYQYITERWMKDQAYLISDSIDWLNKNHFDYRGLIEKGLALDATGLNIY